MNTLLTVMTQIILAADEAPEPSDVKAGWLAFGVVALLIVAMVFLMRSLSTQLKKTKKNAEDGVFTDDE